VTEQSTQDVQLTEPRDFSMILLEINKGESHRELSEALAELVTAVQLTGKAGSISYTLKVQPHANDSIVTVTDQITRKLPEPDRRTSIFFVDDKTRSLVRNDPHQVSIFDMTGAQ
jgi:uncharacterized protein (UPF0218 family)